MSASYQSHFYFETRRLGTSIVGSDWERDFCVIRPRELQLVPIYEIIALNKSAANSACQTNV